MTTTPGSVKTEAAAQHPRILDRIQDGANAGRCARLMREVRNALKTVGVSLHDPIIIGRKGHCSLRSMNVIDGSSGASTLRAIPSAEARSVLGGFGMTATTRHRASMLDR